MYHNLSMSELNNDGKTMGLISNMKGDRNAAVKYQKFGRYTAGIL